MNGLLLTLLVLGLLALGARLFVVVGALTALAFVLYVDGGHIDPASLVRLVNKMENLTTKNLFLSIPFFVAAGTIMASGGIAARLIEIARQQAPELVAK